MYELLDALEEVLRASDPENREKLAETIDAYVEDFPNDFFWATGRSRRHSYFVSRKAHLPEAIGVIRREAVNLVRVPVR